MKKLIIRSGGLPVPNEFVDFSQNFNFAVNQNLILIPEAENRKVFSIECNYAVNNINFPIKFYENRFILLNRDGSRLLNNQFQIINPISGSFSGILSNQSFIVLSERSNIIYFDEPILIGGIQPISQSLQFFTPVNSVICNILYTISYE